MSFNSLISICEVLILWTSNGDRELTFISRQLGQPAGVRLAV